MSSAARVLGTGELLAGLRVQAALATGRSALTAAVLRWHVRALESRPAALRERLLRHFVGRRFVHPWQAALVAAAAVHYQVLRPGARGVAQGRLAALYPSVGGGYSGSGAEEKELGRALWALAEEQPEDWTWFLQEGQFKSSDPGRSLAWMLPAQALQAQRLLPLDLVELGAHAGVLLVGDLLGGEVRVPRVERRLGIDAAPSDLSDPQVRRSLKACLWADQVDRLRHLDVSFATLAALREQGLGPLLLAGDMAQRLGEVISLLCTGAKGPRGPRRLIIYNTLTTASLDEEVYARLQGRVRNSLAEWSRNCGESALWIEMEPPRDRLASDHHRDASRLARLVELRAYQLHDQALEPILLGHLPPYPRSSADLIRHEPGWRRLLEAAV